MSEMVERVARAIVDGESNGNRQWDDIVDVRKPDYLEAARCAIAAMREPTEAMKHIPDIHWGYSCNTCGGLTEGWYAMVDEALK